MKLVPQDLRGHVDPRDHVVRVECQVLLEIQDYKVPLEPTEMREKKGLRVILAQPVHQVFQDQEAHQGLQEVQAYRDRKATRVCQANLGTRAAKVRKDPQVLMEREGHLDDQDLKERGAMLVPLDLKDHRVS